MINFKNIPSDELNEYIQRLDNAIAFVNSNFGFDLNTYGNIIRVSLNAIHENAIENLIERLECNRELENSLDNAGGYSVDYLEENNPKAVLLETLNYLKENLPKQQALLITLNETNRKTVAVVDKNDLDFITQHLKNRKVKLLTFTELKKVNTENKALVFYSFNGKNDFDYLYSLDNEVRLIVYKQEKNLYYRYLDQRKKLIEEEIKSVDRLKICGIKYKEARDNVADISTTINGIITRLDEMGKRTYNSYKDDCDLLLNEIDEKLIYKITSGKTDLFLESNDTIFTDKGDLIKTYKIKVGDKIRVYPKEQLAENLYQVAVETEPEIFGKVEEHATFWKELVDELRKKWSGEMLYQKLREKGLRIKATTLETYGRGNRKFPMYNNDLRAIFKLYYQDKSDKEIDEILRPVFKSKRTYNGAMIVLGRGLKQELRLFLKEREIGEILQKRDFNKNTLQVFADEHMPIHTVFEKTVFDEEMENLGEETLKQIEL